MSSTDAALSPWWEVCLVVATEAADDVGALLIDAGAAGVEVLDVSTPRPALPTLANGQSEAPADAFEPVAGAGTLVVSYDGALREDEVQSAVDQVLEQAGVTAQRCALRRRADTDWSVRWKEFFKPFRCGARLWIVPSWDREFVAPKDAVVIRLDPGLAFGTGQHATTLLCLEIIERAWSKGAPPRVLDARPGRAMGRWN